MSKVYVIFRGEYEDLKKEKMLKLIYDTYDKYRAYKYEL